MAALWAAALAAAALPLAEPAESPAAWISAESYPTDALAAGQEGKVRVTLSVSESGVPDKCTVDRSSGSDALDQGTCAVLMSHARFLPPRNDAGRPSKATWSRNVNWVIPRPAGHQRQYSVAFDRRSGLTCIVSHEGQPRRLTHELCQALADSVERGGRALDRPVVADLPDDIRIFEPIEGGTPPPR